MHAMKTNLSFSIFIVRSDGHDNVTEAGRQKSLQQNFDFSPFPFRIVMIPLAFVVNFFFSLQFFTMWVDSNTKKLLFSIE